MCREEALHRKMAVDSLILFYSHMSLPLSHLEFLAVSVVLSPFAPSYPSILCCYRRGTFCHNTPIKASPPTSMRTTYKAPKKSRVCDTQSLDYRAQWGSDDIHVVSVCTVWRCARAVLGEEVGFMYPPPLLDAFGILADWLISYGAGMGCHLFLFHSHIYVSYPSLF